MYQVEGLLNWNFCADKKEASFALGDQIIEVSIEYDRLGYEYLRVSCEEANLHYSNGSATVATIPTGVIDELRRMGR